MILITGATGNAGSQVVRALQDQGREVRAFVRDVEQARGSLGADVELALGDFAEPRSVRAALEGVDQLVLSGADDPRRVAWEIGAIDAAAAAGVRRIVKLSSIVADAGAPVAFWRWHGQVERHLEASGVPAVVLRSGFYMSNLIAAAGSVAAQGRLYAPAGEARIAMIDPRDVGAAAAAVLSSPGHDRRTYTLTGPEAITYRQAAARLSEATGRRVEYVDVPDAVAEAQLVEAGLPGHAAAGVVEVFAALREGGAELVTTTVGALTGRPPSDFASFAQDHAPRFAPVAVGAGR